MRLKLKEGDVVRNVGGVIIGMLLDGLDVDDEGGGLVHICKRGAPDVYFKS